MSGGSYNYFYSKLRTFADEILEEEEDFDGAKPKPFLETRKEFSCFLHDLAEVCKELEWADSGDISYEDAEKSIKEFLSRRNTTTYEKESLRALRG